MSERRKYHSIPLRTQAKQPRTTDAVEVPQERAAQITRLPANQRTYAATHSPITRATPVQSLVSRSDMPAVPDDDRRQGHTPKSAWLWDKDGNPMVRQGKKEMVFHQDRAPRRFHWLWFVGLGMIATLLLWIGAQWALTSVQASSINAQYGYPRTFQLDAVVGHADSAARPSHFTFENLHDHVIIVELPGGDIAHAHIYGGPVLVGSNADQVPVTGSFEDVNGDGRPDMIVSIGTGTGNVQTITYLNNGSIFVPQS